jgi:hypothetical protein
MQAPDEGLSGSENGLLLAHPTRARLTHAGCGGQTIEHKAPVDLLEVVVPLQGPQLPHGREHTFGPWLASRHISPDCWGGKLGHKVQHVAATLSRQQPKL